ncbi:MAG: hypothetical protein EHM14_15225 [Methanothrix sp.]|nr:MAG: hypothetical protein EHM14_15225 [Methanothrix sp.]
MPNSDTLHSIQSGGQFQLCKCAPSIGGWSKNDYETLMQESSENKVNISNLIPEAKAVQLDLSVIKRTIARRGLNDSFETEFAKELNPLIAWGGFSTTSYTILQNLTIAGMLSQYISEKETNPLKTIRPKTGIDALDGLYIFREPDRIRHFLSGNKTLLSLISSTYANIRKEFPIEKIFLEAVSDSPFSSEEDIVISISTSLPVDEAIDRLDKVDSVRWDKDSRDPYVDICVKLEYK